MPRDITVTLQDGSTHIYKNAPDDVTPDAVNNRASKEFGQSVAHIDGGKAERAPRWDIGGDIGSAFESSVGAIKDDFSSAFKPQAPDITRIPGGKAASLLKVIPDAVSALASPITGALHGVAGSALSYALPTPSKDTVINGTTYFSDPKKAADQILDSSMIGLGPRGIGSAAEVENIAAATAKAREAQRAANLSNKARSKINERAAADNITPEQVRAAQQQAATTGDSISLMDVGGDNVRGLAGAIYRRPGPARSDIKTFLEGRDQAATGGLTRDVQGNIANGSTYHSTQDLLNARSAAARPAFEQAESIGPIHSDRLQSFLDTPEIQAGLRRGLKLERLNAIAENRPFVDSEYGITGYEDGNWDMPIFSKVPTMKSMIVANEGLGAQIADMVHPVTGRITKDGLALKKFRDAYQGELDNLSGGKYRAARDVWSGPSQSMEAVRDGKEHFTRADSNEQIAAEFNALPESDKDFYRIGAAEAKIDALERAPDASDKSKRIINSERDRKRFRILFNSDAEADKFIQSVARKRAMFDTKADIAGNSKTAARQIEDADHDGGLILDGIHGAGQAISGNLLGAARTFLRTAKDIGVRNNPALNSEMARILTDVHLPITADQRQIVELLTLPPGPSRPYIAPSILSGGTLSAPPRPKR